MPNACSLFCFVVTLHWLGPLLQADTLLYLESSLPLAQALAGSVNACYGRHALLLPLHAVLPAQRLMLFSAWLQVLLMRPFAYSADIFSFGVVLLGACHAPALSTDSLTECWQTQQ